MSGVKSIAGGSSLLVGVVGDGRESGVGSAVARVVGAGAFAWRMDTAAGNDGSFLVGAVAATALTGAEYDGLSSGA